MVAHAATMAAVVTAAYDAPPLVLASTPYDKVAELARASNDILSVPAVAVLVKLSCQYTVAAVPGLAPVGNTLAETMALPVAAPA